MERLFPSFSSKLSELIKSLAKFKDSKLKSIPTNLPANLEEYNRFLPELSPSPGISPPQSIIFIPNYYYATFDYLIKSINNKTITNELAGPIGMVKMADQLMLDK